MAERGADGEVRLLYWQAASTLNPYLSGVAKEVEAASIVLEPMARFDDAGALVPALAESVPSVDDGGIAEDLTSITWTLREGLEWSDGTPVTAADAVFTWEYCTHPEGGCAAAAYFDGVVAVEAVDERTVRVRFAEPKPFPYTAFVSAESPILQAAQFRDCLGARAADCTEANFGPIGTGPFVVTEFRPNDVITFAANEHYREPDLPHFGTVTIKGGGDAAGAARAVLETGEYDYAWNLQLDPALIADMEEGGLGSAHSSFAASVEMLFLNQTDPDPALGDTRSTVEGGPHPFLADPAVGRALSMAIDRQVLAEVLYGAAGQPGCNVIPAPEVYASSANDDCLAQDLEGARAVLEEAGWVDEDGDGVRERDGERLSLLYQTSTNAVRQDTQALVKQWWEEIGVETELRNVAASVFFGGDPGSPDTRQKFYADVQMYTDNPQGIDPQSYLASWLCTDMPSPQTQWQGGNIQRFCSEEYDAMVAELARTAEPEARAALVRELNDMLVQSGTIIPLVHRGVVIAWSDTLQGVRNNGWGSELWNIEEWHRAEEG
jgi:peptide/nickel transport system substrate-binding protein